MSLTQLAIQKAINNEWQEAIGLNEQILAENPEDIDALNRIAQAYFNLCQPEKAQKRYSQVLKFDPYNPIAKRNLEKIKNFINNKNTKTSSLITHFNFIEEPGKTKVISLVRIGEKKVLSQIQTCTELELNIRSQCISLYSQKDYIGRLPDDIAKKLIWLYKRNNRYKAYVKSIEKDKVLVFIKEIKQSSINKDHASF